MTDEEYVKSIYPLADIKEIPPTKEPYYPTRSRYFVGIWNKSMCIDIIGSTEFHPEDAWTTAKEAILQRMVEKLSK